MDLVNGGNCNHYALVLRINIEFNSAFFAGGWYGNQMAALSWIVSSSSGVVGDRLKVSGEEFITLL